MEIFISAEAVLRLKEEIIWPLSKLYPSFEINCLGHANFPPCTGKMLKCLLLNAIFVIVEGGRNVRIGHFLSTKSSERHVNIDSSNRIHFVIVMITALEYW